MKNDILMLKKEKKKCDRKNDSTFYTLGAFGNNNAEALFIIIFIIQSCQKIIKSIYINRYVVVVNCRSTGSLIEMDRLQLKDFSLPNYYACISPSECCAYISIINSWQETR